MKMTQTYTIFLYRMIECTRALQERIQLDKSFSIIRVQSIIRIQGCGFVNIKVFCTIVELEYTVILTIYCSV